jgi:hypothetical protein
MDGLLSMFEEQFKKGEPYRDAFRGLLRGDTSGWNKLNAPSLADPQEAVDIATGFAGTIKPVQRKVFEEAFNLAQQRAALPVSEGGLGLPATNTAMDRAKAMGFDTENMWFRGDKPNLSEFNPNDPSNYIKGNIFLSDKKPIASWYAKTGKQKDIMNMPQNESEGVYSLFTKTNPKELKIDAKGESWASIPAPKAWKNIYSYDGTGQIDDIALTANQKKYPSLQVDNVYDQYGLGNQKIIFNPSDIRSVNAAFDPFRRNEPDILAGVAAAPAGLLAIEEEKPKKKRSNK